MKIGFAQINPTVGALRGNCELIAGAYERLAAAGVGAGQAGLLGEHEDEQEGDDDGAGVDDDGGGHQEGTGLEQEQSAGGDDDQGEGQGGTGGVLMSDEQPAGDGRARW